MDRSAQHALGWMRQTVAPTANLTSDSRQVAQGDVFLAYPGHRADGRRFVDDAARHGAAAALFDPEGWSPPAPWSIPSLAVADLKRRAGPIAASWYDEPSRALWSVGVTGTSGKSSCALWIAQALQSLGRRPVFVGTLGIGFPDRLEEAALTTPDAVELQRALRDLRREGADSLAMEVSSIGLAEGRVDALHYDIALFTNLSRDHLDYHGSMQDYEAAKRRLFGWPGLRHAVINVDDPAGERMADLAQQRGVAVTGFSVTGRASAALRASRVELRNDGLSIECDGAFGRRLFATPFIGIHNAANLLGVLGVLLASDVDVDAALAALTRLSAAPGRLERVPAAAGPMVLVDYAHKPDALEKVLEACAPLAEFRHGALIVVFGCGGDRDRGKRPLMGQIAAQKADRVIVTSDNPRSEDPGRIVAEIAAGTASAGGHARVTVTVDRREAIREAIASAADSDVIVIAGKGHETYQEIAGVKYPFSDMKEAEGALAARARGAA